uniref:B-cell receptor CD22-like isoform X4 n=1 Tax=Oncorhynchus gorbuscha TaxID=8017 RepID=UPI001EAF7F2E|nr:B-cell receptor CD22-like isoform X4 [Oncorhynchus gorbuscha]
MVLRTAGSVLVVFLWSVAVVLGQYGWSVTYTKNSICALKGSTVELSCSYTYPRGHRVRTIGWSYWNSDAGRFVEIQSNNEGRVEYRQTTEKDSTLRITDLRQSDKDTYYFRYKTDKSDWKTAQRGVTLSVTELQVEVTGQWNVKTLTCRTSCSLPGNPTYVWYKNRQYLDERTSSIYSRYVYIENAGSYSCAVKGHEDLHSPAVCVHNSNCWSVTYTKRRICVLKGSTVEISCSYTHPTSYIEQGSFWFTQKDPVDVSSYPESAGRVQYNRNTENHHTMTITHLTEKDSAEYIFRLITYKGRFSGLPGVMLTVTDILLEMDPTSVSEGERVTLRCRTQCAVALNPTCIWYKNGQRLTNPVTSYNSLILDPVTSYNSLILEPISSEDAGNYSCAVEGFERILSPEETLTVRYGPKNTSVSVSPSGEIVEGSSVTLTCSSDANPPVDKYTWYKTNIASAKASGQSYSITNIISEDRGEYYCEAQNRRGSMNSTAQMIIVAVKQTSVLTAAVGITVVVLVLILCLSGLMWFRKKASKPTSNTGDTSENEQGDSSPVYDNISGMAMTSTAAQTVATDDQDDVHYASVHFQEVLLYSTIQPSQAQEQDEDIQYATLKLNLLSDATCPTAADPGAAEEDYFVLYSTVNKSRTKKT